jgi:diguanylate cyclase (GGDEF)-like protein
VTEQHILSALLIIITAMDLAFIFYGFKRRNSRFAGPFLFLMVCVSLYCGGYAFEISSLTLREMLLWIRVQYLGISFIPTAWLLLSLTYCGRERWLTTQVRVLLFGLSFMTLIMTQTNSLHNLFYATTEVNLDAPFPMLKFTPGPFYMVNIIYMNFAMLTGNILYAYRTLSSPPAFRRQTILMLSASAIPWITEIAYVAGMFPWSIDPIPFSMIIMGPLFVMGIFRYRLMDVAPIAREKVFESMSDAVLVMDNRGVIVDFNPAAAAIFSGLDRVSIGSDVSGILAGLPDVIAWLKSEEADAGELELSVSHNGGYYNIRLSTVTDSRNNPVGRMLLLLDVTRQKELMDQMAELAVTDVLTGLRNRRYFMENAGRELTLSGRYASPISVIIADIDHFKSVNDTCGHEAGDRVLVHVSDVFSSFLREGDILCRYGGEEFAFALPHTGAEGAIGVAERLRGALSSKTVSFNGVKIPVTASFGVAQYSGGNLDDLMREADRALYAAKERGRNRVEGSPSIY